ncbi:MAG: hypothetical protein ABTQ26_00170, partial [Azonexus sp.]
MTAVTINGNGYSDDGSQSRDMRFGGHQTWLLPMLQDTMTEVDAATNAAISADSSASAASGSATAASTYAAALKGTSATPMTPATGTNTFTTQAGKQWGVGQAVMIVSAADSTHWMIGQVTSYSTTSLQVSVSDANGATSKSDWSIYVSGLRGAQGATGAAGTASIPYSAKSANYTVATADKAKLIDCSSTFTLSFNAAATLGADWWCYVRNGGSGDITIDPSGAETIDGMTTFVCYPGEVRLIQCDGSALRSVVVNPYYKAFTASGTFTKP